LLLQLLLLRLLWLLLAMLRHAYRRCGCRGGDNVGVRRISPKAQQLFDLCFHLLFGGSERRVWWSSPKTVVLILVGVHQQAERHGRPTN